MNARKILYRASDRFSHNFGNLLADPIRCPKGSYRPRSAINSGVCSCPTVQLSTQDITANPEIQHKMIKILAVSSWLFLPFTAFQIFWRTVATVTKLISTNISSKTCFKSRCSTYTLDDTYILITQVRVENISP